MTTVLYRVTLGLVATIVVLLAGHLILIAASLVRANRNLAELVGGLESIRDHTAPLGPDLTAINEAAVAIRDGLAGVDDHLRGIARLARG